jgi:hypothetical protein
MYQLNTSISSKVTCYNLANIYTQPIWARVGVSPQLKASVGEVIKYPVLPPLYTHDPVDTGQGQLYQEDSKIIKIIVNGNTGLYECARFYVPRGSIGVVRQLWQWLEIKNAPATPPVISTPFDALGHTRDTGQAEIDILWKFRLFHGKRRGPLFIGPSGNLPSGWGYPRFSDCRELRFPWGSNAPVFLLVPEHHTFIAYGDILLGKNEIDTMGIRISGYIQTISRHSLHNSRHGFTW